MANKFDIISGRAPHYWGGGGGIRCRIKSEMVSEKVLSANYDKIMAMGLPVALWLEASKIQDNLPVCSCVKDTSKQADIPCLSCYGTGNIPGFFKFGTKNYWKSSIEGGWTLINLALNKTNRPFRFELTEAATTGTATTADISVSLLGKVGPWEANFDGFTRDGGVNSSITVEGSVNSGGTWFPISAIALQAIVDKIRFRVTITRSTTSVKSPMFEIVRIRYPIITDMTGELDEPVIRVIQTWLTEAELRTNIGTREESQGGTFWGLPLGAYDPSIQLDNIKSKIRDNAFIEQRYGAERGYRHALTNFSYSDEFGKFTRQQFAVRKIAGEPGKIQGEHLYRVW